MSNLTSTLTLKLADDGLAKKAAADAEALKRLGASGADLKRLAAANPAIGKLTKSLDDLAGKGAKLDSFKSGSRALKDLGASMRRTRADATATAEALARAQTGADPKVLRAAEKAYTASLKRQSAARDAFLNQGRAVRDARNELLSGGIGRAGRGLNIAGAERQLAAATENANSALKEQIALLSRAGSAARRHDLLSGMGAAGRGQLDRIEAGRRLADGMSAPGRARRDAHAQEAEQAALALAERRQNRRDAWKGAAGLVGLGAVHRAEHFGGASLHAYAEMDDLMRYQRAVAGLSQDESKSRYKQALHLGGVTGFSDLDVAHAQLDLAQRGVKKELVEPMIEQIVAFAQAMNTTLGDAAKTMEGVVFTTNQNVDDAATAGQTMRRQVDLAVKGAKLGGLDADDLKAAFKFGAPTGSSAGLSNETMLAMFGQLRRAGFAGAEAGTAVRSISSRLVTPTSKTLTAYDAMGVDFSKFTTMPQEARRSAPAMTMKRQFGKSLSKAQQARFDALMDDPEIFGDQAEFTKQASDIVRDNFEKVAKGKNKGKMKAQDAARVAKVFGGLWKAMVASVDVEGLWDAILDADPTTGQATLAFGDKRAGQVMALARKKKEFRESREALKHTKDGFAQDVGDTRMGGFAGAKKRLSGAIVSVETALPRSLDNNGQGGALTSVTSTLASTIQAFAELPPAAHQAAVALGIVGSAVVGVKSLGLLADGFGLKGSATSLTGAAEALTAAAARLGAAGAMDGAANAAGAAAGGKGFGSRLGKLGAAGFLGGAGLGIIAIGAGVAAIDYLTPENNNRMNGYGRARRRPENDLRSYPADWGPGGGVNVGAGIGATGGSYTTNRAKTWSETIFGSTRAGGRDPTRMDLPLPPGMMPRAPAAPAAPTGASQSVPLPPARPVEFGGAAPKVDTSQIEGVTPKVEAAKEKLSELGGASARPTVDTSSIAAAEGAVDRLLGKLAQVGGAAASANAQVASISSPSSSHLGKRIDAHLQARANNSFSDYVTSGMA